MVLSNTEHFVLINIFRNKLKCASISCRAENIAQHLLHSIIFPHSYSSKKISNIKCWFGWNPNQDFLFVISSRKNIVTHVALRNFFLSSGSHKNILFQKCLGLCLISDSQFHFGELPITFTSKRGSTTSSTAGRSWIDRTSLWSVYIEQIIVPSAEGWGNTITICFLGQEWSDRRKPRQNFRQSRIFAIIWLMKNIMWSFFSEFSQIKTSVDLPLQISFTIHGILGRYCIEGDSVHRACICFLAHVSITD